ncbi:MAG: hypothetical protein FD169_739 [Bacillota bacterium]|nr:MAG: hypothetical protein FD169_739 [Bacillota bacterium]
MKKARMSRRKRAKSVARNHVFHDATGKDVELQRGDVIGIDRGLYEHYGIYCGNNEVIHYTSAPLRRLARNRAFRIYRTDMSRFLNKQKQLFVLDCTDPRNPFKSEPITIGPQQIRSLEWFKRYDIDSDFHLYSPEETVERAESQLGKGEYNLAVNNCEHFAVWCKTGLHKSYQVDEVLKHFRRFFYCMP